MVKIVPLLNKNGSKCWRKNVKCKIEHSYGTDTSFHRTFLADRTNGRAYATVLRPSSSVSNVM